jgi:hypothetical protein
MGARFVAPAPPKEIPAVSSLNALASCSQKVAIWMKRVLARRADEN